jgi:hypothetical protein
MSKIKAFAVALGMALALGVGTVSIIVGRGAGSAAIAGDGPANARPNAEALVKQLGDAKFAEREAAQAKLRAMGAPVAAAVWAGRGESGEVAKRCDAIWPLLWETELAKPDAERLAGYKHPVWVRFRKVVGDDAGSRRLYIEMAGDVRRFARLAAAEADPARAGDVYLAELTDRVQALKQGYLDSESRNRFNTGLTWPSSGIPNRGEFATLLFLGTYPATAAVTFQAADDRDRMFHHNVFGMALHPNNRGTDPIAPALRRLYAAWFAARTNDAARDTGLSLGLHHGIAEIAPTARKLAADAALTPRLRGFALLAVGRFSTAADLPLVEKAFDDNRVFHETNYTDEKGVKSPIVVLVKDAAVAAALRLAGQHPADFGFPYLVLYKERSPDSLTKFYLLGFSQPDDRVPVHQKATKWLKSYKGEKTEPKPGPEPSGGLRQSLYDLDGYRNSSDKDFDKMEAHARELLVKYPDRDDRAHIYYQIAHVYAQSDIRRYPERVTKYGNLALELSRDPVQRGVLHSYLASAAEVDPAGGKFPQRRRLAAERLLAGYKELLQFKLPKVAPELPIVNKIGPDFADEAERQTLEKQHAEQTAARRQAEFLGELVHRRETLTGQLRYLYGIEPHDDAELRQLVEKMIDDPASAADLLAAATPARR